MKGYVKLENYFLDGSTLALDASAREIEAENAKEEVKYGEKDLESKGGGGSGEETAQALRETLQALNERPKVECSKAAREAFKRLEKYCQPQPENMTAETNAKTGELIRQFSRLSLFSPLARCFFKGRLTKIILAIWPTQTCHKMSPLITLMWV